jgi:hypothetical protein
MWEMRRASVCFGVFGGASGGMFYEIRLMREYIMGIGVFGLKEVWILGGCVIPSCTHMTLASGIIKAMEFAFRF